MMVVPERLSLHAKLNEQISDQAWSMLHLFGDSDAFSRNESNHSRTGITKCLILVGYVAEGFFLIFTLTQ